MPQRRERGTPEKMRLSRARILKEAVAIADREGLDALTMRKLASGFDVVPMAIYKHVANKEDMLDGMVDVIFSEVELPREDVDWKTATRERAISARKVLARHPWAIGMTESRMKPGEANLRHREAVIGCFRRGGFPIAMAIHASSVVDSYLYGFLLQERSLPFDSTEELGEQAQGMLDQFPSDDFPYLAETIAEVINAEAWEFANEFEFGLDLILDGLEALLDS